jgi:hypothetical protein
MTLPTSGSSCPTESDVARIAVVQDAAARNTQITEAYSHLSAETERRIHGHANWCTFATWASQQAGVTIRHEDLADTLRDRLNASWKISGVDRILIELLEEGGLDLLQLVVDSVANLGPLKRSADAVGDGNRKVFAEIGLQFARWLALFPDVGSITDAQMDAFVQSLTSGPPPGGQDLLRQAFATYHSAARAADTTQEAQLMLLANLQIGYHEQVRLQSDIKAALDGALIEPRDLADLLLEVLGPRQSAAARAANAVWPLGESPVEKAAMMLAQDVHQVVRALITEQLMSLRLPPDDVVQLGSDLRRPFPAALQSLTNPDVLKLLATFDPTLGNERGSGAQDWADFSERMRFIADLFRAYADDPHLFESPGQDSAKQPPRVSHTIA